MSIQAQIRAIQKKGRDDKNVAESLNISVGLFRRYKDNHGDHYSQASKELETRLKIIFIAVILADMFEKMVAMILVLLAVSIGSLIEGVKRLINILHK